MTNYSFPHKYGRLLILIGGFLTLCEVLEGQTNELFSRMASAFLMLQVIYWFPSRLDVDFVFWLKGSVITAIIITLIHVGLLNALSVLLIMVFFVFWLNKRRSNSG